MLQVPVTLSTQTKHSYRIDAARLVDELPVAHWDSIVGDDTLFLQAKYLRQVERTLDGSMNFYYVLFWEDDLPIGISYFQRIHIKGTGVRMQRDYSFKKNPLLATVEQFNNWLKKNINRLNIQLLVQGNSFISGEYSSRFVDSVSKELGHELMLKGIETIKQEEKQHTINMVMIKDFIAGSMSEDSAFVKKGFTEVELQPNMELDIRPEWKSAEDYLQAMSSKYRVRARSARKKGKDLVVEPLGVNGAKEYSQEMYQLYRNIAEEAEFNLAFLGPDYFSIMKERLPDNFFLTAYFEEETLIGFISYFIHGKDMEAHFMGYDKALNRKYKLYQNVLYDLVERGIEAGVEHIAMGRTALEIKSTVGAVGVPMNCYVRHDNSLKNQFLGSIFRQLNNETFVPRSPFKKKNA